MFYLGPGERSEPVRAVDWLQRYEQLRDSARHPDLKAFYSAGLVSGETPLAEVPFVALDFETTGLNPQKHGIISIGLVPFDLGRVRPGAGRQWLVRPRRPLSETSVVIHGITHQAVAEAPDLADIFGEVLECLAGRIIVVHHRGIERPFLDNALQVRIGEGIDFPVIDTMALEALLHRKPLSLWSWLRGKRPASIRLAASRERYGLPFYPPHNAVTDALATAELFQAQVAHHYSPDTSLAQLWC